MSLIARDLVVQFGGRYALDGVSVNVELGEVTALIGPNGAGKTTTFNCIAGLIEPVAGSIELDGADLTRLPVEKRVRAGLARSFQTPRVDLDNSVTDNIRVGLVQKSQCGMVRSLLRTPKLRREGAALAARAAELADEFGFVGRHSLRAAVLSLGELRMLEVARALAAEPKYVLLDEPAAGLDDEERDVLAECIEELANSGTGVLIVEHSFPFVERVAKTVVAMANGKIIAREAPADIRRNPEFIATYLGRSGATEDDD